MPVDWTSLRTSITIACPGASFDKEQPINLTDLLVLLAIFSSIGFTPDGADFSDSSRTTYFKHLKKSLFLLKLSVLIAS